MKENTQRAIAECKDCDWSHRISYRAYESAKKHNEETGHCVSVHIFNLQ